MNNIHNEKEIRISRILNVSREKVWDAWTKPEEVMKWWGPEGFTSPFCEIDLRVGGKYLFCMRGSIEPEQEVKDYWSGGAYKEIVPFEKLVCTDYFSNENGDIVDPTTYGMSPNFPKVSEFSVLFEDYEGKTKLSIVYFADSEEIFNEMVESKMEEGWESSLDKLVESLS